MVPSATHGRTPLQHKCSLLETTKNPTISRAGNSTQLTQDANREKNEQCCIHLNHTLERCQTATREPECLFALNCHIYLQHITEEMLRHWKWQNSWKKNQIQGSFVLLIQLLLSNERCIFVFCICHDNTADKITMWSVCLQITMYLLHGIQITMRTVTLRITTLMCVNTYN